MTAKQIFDTLNEAKEQKGAKLKHLPIHRESYVRFEKTGGITLTSLIELAEYLGYSVELIRNRPST